MVSYQRSVPSASHRDSSSGDDVRCEERPYRSSGRLRDIGRPHLGGHPADTFSAFRRRPEICGADGEIAGRAILEPRHIGDVVEERALHPRIAVICHMRDAEKEAHLNVTPRRISVDVTGTCGTGPRASTVPETQLAEAQGAPEPISAKAQAPKTPVAPIRGAALEFEVPDEVWTALRQVALNRRVTVKYLVLEALVAQGLQSGPICRPRGWPTPSLISCVGEGDAS